jgi:hypothetical protein
VQVKDVAGGRGTSLFVSYPADVSSLSIGDIDDVAFQITLSYPRGGDTVSLRATSVRDCQLWMQMIDHATKRCREAEKKAARAIGRG